MMRFAPLLLGVFTLASCGFSGAPSLEDLPQSDDGRMAFMLYHTPQISYGEALTCFNFAKDYEEEFAEVEGEIGALMENHMVDYYSMLVARGLKAEADDEYRFSGGQFTEIDGAPKLLSGGILKRSEQCGEIIGAALTSSGFATAQSLMDVIADGDMEVDSNMDAGLKILSLASNSLSGEDVETVVTCASAIRARYPAMVDLDPQGLAWMMALALTEKAGRLDSADMSELSESYRVFTAFDGFPLGENDALSDQNEACRAQADVAIEEATKEFTRGDD